MKNLAKLYAEQTGVDLTNMPGAGAAGGIGGAMCAFFKAKLLKVGISHETAYRVIRPYSSHGICFFHGSIVLSALLGSRFSHPKELKPSNGAHPSFVVLFSGCGDDGGER